MTLPPAKIEPGSGLATIFQLTPFQCSMIVPTSTRDTESPTAKQLVVLAHDTLFNSVSMSPAGFGLAMTFQLEPFHRSMNACDDSPV